MKTIMGVTVAGALLGLGVLAGSVMGTSNVSAQTPSTTPTAVPSQPGTKPADPSNGLPFGKHGMEGMGGRGMKGGGMRGGPGDFGGKGWGGDSAQGTSMQITRTTNLITQVKADLAYANGKMDTADVQRWVNGADSLLQSAQTANSGSKYEQAGAYAQAASQLAMVAETQMAQTLGADKLPSYSQRPQHPNRQAPAATAPTQAQASRILNKTYNEIVRQGALVKSASSAGDAATYLTDAQNAYKTAYDAYQAGNYADAAASARLAGELSEVTGAVLRAATAPATSDTPVTVPAPNFQ
ncbi:MAG: hypothetical protein ABI670_18260 [Chloroflexota bacterium]